MCSTNQPVHQVAHAKASDYLNIAPETPAAIVATLEEYFARFAAPVFVDDKQVCHHCGGVINGFLQAVGAAVAYRWQIVHGEANCTGCGWPARGMHYIKDAEGTEIISARNLFIAYHPDSVVSRDTEED